MPEPILDNPAAGADGHSSLIMLDRAIRADKPVVLIPAYQPETAVLISLVEELSASGRFSGIIVVNDGSGPAYRELFHSLAQIGGVTVLPHVINLGKGAALKTGLNHAACAFPESVGV